MTVTPIKGMSSFEVDLPLSVIDGILSFKSLEVHQAIREHDTVVLTAEAQLPSVFDTLASGTPIAVQYNNTYMDMSATFYGYITHIKPLQDSGKNVFRRQIIAVAASRDFRRTGNEVWRNKTVPEIIKDIGKTFGFKVVTKQHPLRRKQTAQSGMTYWEFMSKMAKRIGYVLRVEGSTIFFLPLKSHVKSFRSRAPYLSNYQGVAPDLYPTLLSLTAWAGDTSDDEDDLSDAAVVVAVEPVRGTVHRVRQAPESAVGRRPTVSAKYTKYQNTVVAHSREDAKNLAKGMADNGMMALDAKITAIGDPGLSPYRPVYVQANESELNGWWIVKEAVHRMNRVTGEYMTEAVVSTDSLAPSSFAAPSTTRYRDVRVELEEGWSPDQIAKVRLKSTSTSFVKGLTRNGESSSRWIAV